MQNYYPDLAWKIDKLLLLFFAFLIFAIIIYIFLQELSLKILRKKLINIKNNIYKLLLQEKAKSVCFTGMEKLTPKQFIDVVTNRSRWAVFFNEEEQEYFKHCFINQENIVKIERIAKNSKNKWRRIEAMLALGFASAPSALGVLEKGLFNKDPDISYFSLLALGRIKTDLSLRILLGFLKKNALRRQKAASLLENFPPSAVDQIIELADEPDPQLRFWAIKILLRFKPVKHIEKIKILCQDVDPNVRAAACECLGNIGGKEAQESLFQHLEDESWIVRCQAARALSEAMGAGCVQYIAHLLSCNSLNVIEAVGDILLKHVDVALPYLEKLLTGDDALAKKKAIEIMVTSGFLKSEGLIKKHE